jgi:hypothetical protein
LLAGAAAARSFGGDLPAALEMIRDSTATSSARCSGLSRVNGLAGCGVGRKFRDSCTGALRVDRLLMVAARVSRAPQQTVDDCAQVHQVRNRPQSGRRNRRRGREAGSFQCFYDLAKIRPVGRNQDRIDIWRRQKKMQTAISLPAAKYSHPLPLERVARANNDYLFRNGLAVGSLLIDRSIRSVRNGWSVS